jgi:hypothetical protein
LIINTNEAKNESNEIENIACAEFDLKEGWHLLDIKTYRPYSNEIQSYFAGYIEGYIYHELISFHHKNIYETIFNGEELNENLRLFLYKQEEYIRNLSKSKGNLNFYFYLST